MSAPVKCVDCEDDVLCDACMQQWIEEARVGLVAKPAKTSRVHAVSAARAGTSDAAGDRRQLVLPFAATLRGGGR